VLTVRACRLVDLRRCCQNRWGRMAPKGTVLATPAAVFEVLCLPQIHCCHLERHQRRTAVLGVKSPLNWRGLWSSLCQSILIAFWGKTPGLRDDQPRLRTAAENRIPLCFRKHFLAPCTVTSTLHKRRSMRAFDFWTLRSKHRQTGWFFHSFFCASSLIAISI